MSNLYNQAIAAANNSRDNRVLSVTKKQDEQAQIGTHAGFDFNSGLPIVKFPNGGEVRYIPLNFGNPTNQISVILTDSIARADWRGY